MNQGAFDVPHAALRYTRRSQGITFIDVVIGVALALVVFGGLFGAFRLSIELISISKERSGAAALANEQIEFLRSMPYDDVGTISGIPAGTVPQLETVSLNRTEYTRRTLILYEDSPSDGLDGADENGITTDYKRVKVSVSWAHREQAEEFFLATTIVPKGIETNAGGGTLRISVIDSNALPVAGASVAIQNPGLVPVIDTTIFTNVLGQVTLGGAPAASGYEITVSKTGMSRAQTYGATVANPNPNPQHLTVASGITTSATFAIDFEVIKAFITLEPIVAATFTDPFIDGSKLLSQSFTEVVGGELRLLDGGGGIYEPSGSAQSNAVTDPYLYGWSDVTFVRSAPAATDGRLFVYYDTGGGVMALVPDVDLPGNASGFTMSPISLAGLSTSTYQSLALGAAFTTADPLATPSISEWHISYRTGPVPIPNVAISIQGTKTIGTNASAALIYKYDVSTTTNAEGVLVLPSLEWDQYITTVTDAMYGIAESCPSQPESLVPGSVGTTTLTLVPATPRSLLVAARSVSGLPIPDLTATLEYGGTYTESQITSSCGSALFDSLPSNGEYTLTISGVGYVTDSASTTISGNEYYTATIIES